MWLRRRVHSIEFDCVIRTLRDGAGHIIYKRGHDAFNNHPPRAILPRYGTQRKLVLTPALSSTLRVLRIAYIYVYTRVLKPYIVVPFELHVS